MLMNCELLIITVSAKVCPLSEPVRMPSRLPRNRLFSMTSEVAVLL